MAAYACPGVQLDAAAQLAIARGSLPSGGEQVEATLAWCEAQLRVGDTIFTWREGEAFVFDDSFEHEVTWNPPVETIDLSAEEARLVLIVDFQHPDVNPVCHSQS